MCWAVIIFQLLSVMNFHSVISYQINELLVNTSNPNRLKRAMEYNSIAELDNPLTSNIMNIFFRIRADRKGLITCEVNSKEVDSFISTNHTFNQTQSNNESIIENKPTSTLYLICPQLSTSICYMDCSPNCVLNENGCTIPPSIAQVIEGCQFKRINASTFQYQYVINMEELDHTGLWNCEYRGQRAVRSLELQAAETPSRIANSVSNHIHGNHTNSNIDSKLAKGTFEENVTGTVNTKKQSKANKINPKKSKSTENRPMDKANMGTIHQDNLTNLNEELKNDTLNKKHFHLMQKKENQLLFDFKLTRPELVLSLIGILAVSLIMNIILIVRCILLKSYLDNTKHGKISSHLKCLLCLQSKSNHIVSTSMNKSFQQSNHQPVLMTSSHVGQLFEPNTTFMNYSTQIDDSLTESVLLYSNKPENCTHNGNHHLLTVNCSNSIVLPNQPNQTTTLSTQATNVSYVSTTPTFQHQLVNSASTIHPHDLLRFRGWNGQTSSGFSLESDPTSTKRTNLFHSQSVNYSKQSNHHPLLSECCFQNGSINVPGQNGSLNGSLLYSNDSTSLTDTTNGNGVIIPNHVIVSQNPYSAYRMQYICAGEQSDKSTRKFDLQQQSKLHQKFISTNDHANSMYQRIPSEFASQLESRPRINTEQSNSDDIENDETCNLITEKPMNQDLHNYAFRNSSTIDSLSHGTNNSTNQLEASLTLHPNALPSCLTPLVVRFPSGESGFLFCPTRATSENYQSESLSRQSNRLSMTTNHTFKPISKDKRENNQMLSSDIKMNSDCFQTNLELVKFDNLTKSSRTSHDSENSSNVLFQLDKSQHSFPRNNNEFISTHIVENYQNHEEFKNTTINNSDFSSVHCEPLSKSSFNYCMNNTGAGDMEMDKVQTPLRQSIPQNCEFTQFKDSSNDALLHKENVVQELNINSTIYPVR
ncbi:unnamed protein product [Schistosoma turkestanicum]|nr:unnamed protein product [Schistosoma turkestanicum]